MSPLLSSVRTILVATDYSRGSEHALETAVALATRFAARLAVLHVVEDGAWAYPSFPMPRDLRDAAAKHLLETVAGLRARMLDASGFLRQGLAPDEICAAARDLHATLVVIGSQGRRGLPRFVLGSVAERVVRLSTVPVLTVHPSDHVSILAGGMDRFRHILAPTDLSEASQRGVDAAVTLALELDAWVTLVHVYEVPSYAYYVLGDGSTAEARAHAQRELDEVLARVRARFPEAEGVLRQGIPWRGILDVAKERRANLIVLSTHGHRRVQHALIGSVAEKIVRLSPVPVVTVGTP
jgi:nucleotide-binding universal stress UspA family protein